MALDGLKLLGWWFSWFVIDYCRLACFGVVVGVMVRVSSWVLVFSGFGWY